MAYLNRQDLLRKASEELLRRGRTDVSLAELGTAIGVSARMLVYHFGSRESLMQQVLSSERERQQTEIAQYVASGLGPIEILRAYFHDRTEPGQRSTLRFFFDLVAEANRNPETYGEFLSRDSVRYWMAAAARLTEESELSEHERMLVSLALGAARGLYIELLSTGDAEQVRRTYDQLLEWIADAWKEPR